MRVHAKIQKWGNSLGLRISGAVKEIPKFKENMAVNIEVTEKSIEVFPAPKNRVLPFSEAQLLKGLTRKKAHADELASIQLHEFGEE